MGEAVARPLAALTWSWLGEPGGAPELEPMLPYVEDWVTLGAGFAAGRPWLPPSTSPAPLRLLAALPFLVFVGGIR